MVDGRLKLTRLVVDPLAPGDDVVVDVVGAVGVAVTVAVLAAIKRVGVVSVLGVAK